MNFRESLPGSLSDAGRIRGETQAKKVTHELEADGKLSNKKTKKIQDTMPNGEPKRRVILVMVRTSLVKS